MLKFAKWLKKPIFTTIEGNVTDSSKPNLIALFKEEKYDEPTYYDEDYKYNCEDDENYNIKL